MYTNKNEIQFLNNQFKMQGLLRCLRLKYIFFFIFVTFMVTCLISISPINIDQCKCPNEEDWKSVKAHKLRNSSKYKKKYNSRLAILVPFRDRFEELLSFVPHMTKFLDKQNLDYEIFVLNQVDKYRFNRASLINVGFLYVKNNYNYIAMHDVDLLPLNDELIYSYPDKNPFHVSSPELHPRYHYPTFVGGILLVKREHFIMVNGMSNKYWGWGLEDDEFYVRLKEVGLSIDRPKNISTGTHNTFKHIHDRAYRKRDTTKCFNQREVTRKRDRQTGLTNVDYKITEVIEMTISGAQLTVINISLNCDKTITPWCECNGANEQKVVKTNDTKKVANVSTR